MEPPWAKKRRSLSSHSRTLASTTKTRRAPRKKGIVEIRDDPPSGISPMQSGAARRRTFSSDLPGGFQLPVPKPRIERQADGHRPADPSCVFLVFPVCLAQSDCAIGHATKLLSATHFGRSRS